MLRSASRLPSSLLTARTAAGSMQQFARAALSGSEERVEVTFHIAAEEEDDTVMARVGDTFLDVAREFDIDVEGACEGELACSTCHCVFPAHIYDTLGEVGEEEQDMLDLAWGLTDTSRLGCQVKVTPEMAGIRVIVPEETSNMLDDEF